MDQGHNIIPLNVRVLLEDEKFFRDYCRNSHPATVAEKINGLESTTIIDLLNLLNVSERAEIYANFDEEKQKELGEMLSTAELAEIMTFMPHDDRVDFFELLSEDKQEVLMSALAKAEREDIKNLASYEDGTVGAYMTTDYAVLGQNLTATEAVETLRKEAPAKETIYDSYVVDQQRRLIGVVSLRDLILAPAKRPVSEIMKSDVIYAYAHEDRTDAAEKLSKYDLMAVPVVNETRQLVGIVTSDDVIDILEEETTEDIERMMAVSPGGGEYLETSSFTHFKKRSVWLVVLTIMGVFSEMMITHFEDILTRFIILAMYMPMIAGTGGNTGSQACTVVIRAISIGQLTTQDFFHVLWKEMKIGFMLSACLGLVALGKVMILSHAALLPPGIKIFDIAFAISIALSIQVVTSTLLGASLPVLATKIKLDPTVVAAPMLTTMVDLSGLFVYFYTTKLLLGL